MTDDEEQFFQSSHFKLSYGVLSSSRSLTEQHCATASPSLRKPSFDSMLVRSHLLHHSSNVLMVSQNFRSFLTEVHFEMNTPANSSRRLTSEEVQHLLQKLSSDEQKELGQMLKVCTTEMTFTRGKYASLNIYCIHNSERGGGGQLAYPGMVQFILVLLHFSWFLFI